MQDKLIFNEHISSQIIHRVTMSYFINLAYTSSLLGLMTVNVVLCKLNAITDFDPWYTSQRYLGHEFTSAQPSESDPASTDASVRLQICEEISRSGVFTAYELEPVLMEDVYDQLMQDVKHSEIFHRIYKRSPPYIYDNAYRQKRFELTKPFPTTVTVPAVEFVFVCLLKVAESAEAYTDDDDDDDESYEQSDYDESDPEGTDGDTEEDEIREDDSGGKTKEDEIRKDESGRKTKEGGIREDDSDDSSEETHPGDIVPFYVTKMYGTAGTRHRFVLTEDENFEENEVMLVEESATTSIALNFNIESHYLELRKNHSPVSDYVDDPVCKLNLGHFLNNQHFQLCVLVFKSEYFEDKVVYPNRVFLKHCLNERIFFQTAEGKGRGAAKSYSERMLACEVSVVGARSELFYVSRAYHTNHAFVYTEVAGKFFLEALVTNVNIVREPFRALRKRGLR